MAAKANETQVGGGHYKQSDGGEEHWDRVSRLNLDYFQGQITKYVERWKKKNGVEDLKKARHFLDKYIELNEKPWFNPEGTDMLIFHTQNGDLVGRVAVDFGSERKPDGWIGYVFEGGTAEGDLYKCKTCRQEVKTKMHQNPNEVHACMGKLETHT